MTFRSAKSDFEETTLAALPSGLERLEYLASLRAGDEYHHWGLAKVYGAEEAERVLRAAHGEALDAVLRRRLQELYAEAEQAPEMLARAADELLPAGVDDLRKAHFNLVWDALQSVARHRSSRRPAA